MFPKHICAWESQREPREDGTAQATPQAPSGSRCGTQAPVFGELSEDSTTQTTGELLSQGNYHTVVGSAPRKWSSN